MGFFVFVIFSNFLILGIECLESISWVDYNWSIDYVLILIKLIKVFSCYKCGDANFSVYIYKFLLFINVIIL